MMNKKENILNAWIMIEHLSEGSIKKTDLTLQPFQTQATDLHTFFMDFIGEQKTQQNVSDKNFEKSGLIMYFDIFDFEEVVEILREKYNILPTDEDVSNSNKFTFSLSFDNQLNFLSDQLFFTVSGYIRYHGELPEDFLKEEASFREDLNRKFEQDFNTVMTELFQTYKVSRDNFRYTFVKNMDNADAQLHSFFIDDLQKAKTVHNKNLDRYFGGFSGKRKNLDGNKGSLNFNPHLFEGLLQPQYYPLGRFPSHPDHSLSFMQQVAVNLALNEKNDIRSVNGPPGTGKTTLLKDIFADLLVQQAIEICKLPNKNIKGELTYWEYAKLGVLPSSISDKNIVVTSSNNGAVQNIVNELPKKEGIADHFQAQLVEADYFHLLSNSEISSEGFGKDRKLKIDPSEEKNWGTFSLEGGASVNMNKLLLNVEFIEHSLEEEYQSNPDIYQHFLDLYHQLDVERKKIQRHSEKMKELLKLKMEHESQSTNIEQKTQKRQVYLKNQELKDAEQIERLNMQISILEQELSEIQLKMKNQAQNQKQAERNYDVITAQEPKFLWLYKIFNRSKVNEYFQKLNSANDILNKLSNQSNELFYTESRINQGLKKNEDQQKAIHLQKDQEQVKWNQWIKKQQVDLKKLDQKIKPLEECKAQSEIEDLDFSKSYATLQKSNPWFNKEFRIKQSELFIVALKVRKQFLFENKKHIKTARIIWSQQQQYLSKENGQRLIIESWQWLNFAIPVVSTTFASFGRMFKNLGENSIGNLFVDEAGQALPQASVGAIFRSKKVMVVGDPSQIKPVLNLDSNVLNLIGRHYQVNEKFVSDIASTQTLVDATSQYGFQKNEDEWIGIPLWVHRRSDDPMFTLSNELSYNGLMVQGKPENQSQGISIWYHCTGRANDKFVKEQAELLEKLIDERLQNNPELEEEIYVISPFRNVAQKLAQALDKIHFTKWEKGKSTNVGTVHTFQGKEAKIVYFVLGADTNSKGAAKWAVSDPNMMNVATTRAKNEFYVIGDKELYASLGSKVANTTITIIDRYNN